MLKLGRVLLPFCGVVLITPALAAQEAPPKSSSTLITAQEIERAGVGNAFEAVQLLRPRWLRAHEILLPSPGSDVRVSAIHVYINERDRGDLEILKTIPADGVYTLRFMSTNEVGALYGPSSGPGIVVTLKH